MVASNVHLVQGWLALSEGGYVNHPDDPGGPTNLGVTQKVYSNWLKMNGREPQSVRHITKPEAESIFYEQYFLPVRFSEMPSGLDYAMADFSVNSGPGRATIELQRSLRDLGHKISVDAHIGVETLAAIKKEPDPGRIVARLCERRMDFLRGLKNWKSFGKGWTRRVLGEEPGAQDWDSGVLDRALRMTRELPIAGQPKSYDTPKGTDDPKSVIQMILGVILEWFHEWRKVA